MANHNERPTKHASQPRAKRWLNVEPRMQRGKESSESVISVGAQADFFGPGTRRWSHMHDRDIKSGIINQPIPVPAVSKAFAKWPESEKPLELADILSQIWRATDDLYLLSGSTLALSLEQVFSLVRRLHQIQVQAALAAAAGSQTQLAPSAGNVRPTNGG